MDRPPIEPKPQARSAAASRVVIAVIRLLPYLVATLIIVLPLAFVTTWAPFIAYYDRAWEAFGAGRIADGVASSLQIVLLAIPIVGMTLILMLVGKRLGTAAWQWSEGRPILRTGLLSARFGLAAVAVVAVGVGLFTWLSNDDKHTTDGRTLKDQVAALLNNIAQASPAKPKKFQGVPAGPVLDPQPEEESDAATSPGGQKSSEQKGGEQKSGQTSGGADGKAAPNSEATPTNPAVPAPRDSSMPSSSTTEPSTSPAEPAATPTAPPPSESLSGPPPSGPPPSEASPPANSSGSSPPSDSSGGSSPAKDSSGSSPPSGSSGLSPPSESPPPSGSSPPPSGSSPPLGSSPSPEGKAPSNTPTQISLVPGPGSKNLSFSYP